MTSIAGLRLQLVAPARMGAGDSVPIVIVAENVGRQPLELYLRGRTIAFDITAARQDGTVVWRRLEGAVTQMILQLRVLQSGERLELVDEWNQLDNAGQPVNPGSYDLTGMLLTEDPEPLRTRPLTIRILANA